MLDENKAHHLRSKIYQKLQFEPHMEFIRNGDSGKNFGILEESCSWPGEGEVLE